MDFNTDRTDAVLGDVERLMDEKDLDRSEALQLLMVSELRELNATIDTVETHTNNTVRKL